MDKSQTILTLRASGYSERRIAQTLGVSRGAVRRHLASSLANSTKAQTGLEPAAQTGCDDANSTKAQTGSDGSPEAVAAVDDGGVTGSACEAFRSVISEKSDAGLSAKRIHQDLVADHGFEGKYWSVYRFVKTLRVGQELPYRRMEVEPGEELQVDFGSGAKIRKGDGTFRKTHVFRCVLSHSRKGYTEAVFRQDTESFIRALENAFWSFGGVPQRVVFDNAKCAVKTPDWHDPELHPKIVEFCKHYGCAFIPTRVRTPRHKGKVERGVDYVQENALRGREFDTLASQNEHLDRWEKTVADTRIHGTICKQVRGLFESVEKEALSKLPLERFAFYHEVKRKVSRDGHISVNRSCYSVPAEHLARDVWVRYDSRLLRIFDLQLQLIATHAIIERGRFRTDPQHIASSKISPIERGIAHLLGKIRLFGPSSTRWAEAVIAGRGVEAARVLQGVIAMSHKHPIDELEAACETAWRSGALNCRVIRQLLKRGQSASQTTMEFMDAHEIIRPMSEYENFVHDHVQKGIHE